eukprot:CAMPEP_0113464754 /NCGR_PEP_ID=MMETSP0014_2-20120614/13366_1 /TAXON_ID=2857 /ORGANISM="Nitzschia sp." /LENGTH=31 /DNA_ID=CAMNT_0000356849 /DNA_START=130 /DNA_END=222 /DNA_ORIENTATION=+ /assembly_acc=CAM_ASM_000159
MAEEFDQPPADGPPPSGDDVGGEAPPGGLTD